MKHRWMFAILSAAVFLLCALYGLAPLLLPRPAPATVPADQFSAERAAGYMQALAQSPRKAGTPGMQRAASYVMDALRACGLEPELQEAPSPAGTLRNVVARIPGKNRGNVLLILSHLDSVDAGAGDNASGAGVLLEAACALKAGPRPTSDLVLLFEDGEEWGYLGGYAFIQGSPDFAPVRAVIGLDTAAWGPVVLLQTTPANDGIIQAYARAVRSPLAFGFFADADWTISNDTSEITPFYEQGLPGLELEDPTAFTGKHTSADTIDQVQPGSLQQAGDQLLALARSVDAGGLSSTGSSKLSYFTLWGLGVVFYPAPWNVILAVLSALGLAALVLTGLDWKTSTPVNLILSNLRSRKGFTGRALLLAALLSLAALSAAALVGALGGLLFGGVFPNPNPATGSYLLPASLPYFLAVNVLAAAAFWLIRRRVAARWGSGAATLGGQVCWLLMAGVMTALLPVGAYLFTLPLFLAVAAGFLPARWKWAGLIPAGFAAILLVPNGALAFLGTGMQTLALVTLLTALCAELWMEAVGG